MHPASPQSDAPRDGTLDPTWSSSDKDMVTTALGTSRVWATLGHGILNEVYWPSTGSPQIRDLGFIVADGKGNWHELKRVNRYLLTLPAPYVPLPQIVHDGDGYRLELEVLPHPLRDTILIRYALTGDNLKLYVLLAPHLNGEPNTASAGSSLAAHDGRAALSLCADQGFSRASAGFVGVSDGWQDFAHNGAMTWQYATAADGNVALTGELAATSGTLALGFSESSEGAHTLARSSLADDYGETRDLFVTQWQAWGKTLQVSQTAPEFRQMAERSAMVIKVHGDRTYAGALVASLSVPWGSSHDDAGGYHLVWTRDTVESAVAMVLCGQYEDAGRTLDYLIGTQNPDGSWAQNYYPDGRTYWHGGQLDEVALPVLLAAKLREVGHLAGGAAVSRMIRSAISFIVRNGPMTEQDRWEENAGVSPFTLSVAICALVASADYFAPLERDYILSLADSWNERIEDWTFSTDGHLGRDLALPGYYVRLSPRPSEGGIAGLITRRNVHHGETPAGDLVGLEFLYLVRTGLRSADDPRILDTVRLVDQLLRADTPSGPSYYRYNGDGYGEHADGAPFDGIGIGRLWPLLTGERGHYEAISGGNALPYLDAMIRMVGHGGLLPEQIWDEAPLPAHNLFPGKPTGSAMPLVWAHAEFIKLLSLVHTGRPAELLTAIEDRYGGKATEAACWHWRETSPFTSIVSGKSLSIEAFEPFTLHYGFDGWTSSADQPAAANGLGIYQVRLSPADLANRNMLDFTFQAADGSWRGTDFHITIRRL
jgi:glucoamylase